jgi:phosphotransacetylase
MPDMPIVAQASPLPAAPMPRHHATAADLDRLWHSWQSRFTGGRSPSTVSLAMLDWAAHAANAPFQMAELQHRAHGGTPVATAIVFPVDEPSLRAALDAAAAGFIRPVLVGPASRIKLLLTDVAINIRPTLGEKVSIVQNAIDFAHLIGIARPRVVILAAVETVADRMPSTVDAAALCKMTDRGQINGGVLDGPLAFDNAVNEAAAAEKGIHSDVAGKADILVVPDLEAGNMLAKNLTFLSGAEAAGVVLGARMPIILTSRADSPRTRLASCALGVLVARSNQPVSGYAA